VKEGARRADLCDKKGASQGKGRRPDRTPVGPGREKKERKQMTLLCDLEKGDANLWPSFRRGRKSAVKQLSLV